MKKSKVVLIFITALVFLFLTNSQETTPVQEPIPPIIEEITPAPTQVELPERITPSPIVKPISDPLLEIVNASRTARGLNPVVENKILIAGAQKRAEDLVKKGQWSHEGLQEAVIESKFQGQWVGEDLARDFKTDSEIVGAWETSIKHAEIIFDPKYIYGGVGRYENYIILWLGSK